MNTDIAYMILGILMFYIWGHFFVIQFSKNWKKRNLYEKILTILAIVFLMLLLMGTTE